MFAKEVEALVEPNRRPESEKMKSGNVLETSATYSGMYRSFRSCRVCGRVEETELSNSPARLPQAPSSRVSNDSPAVSQDEDDNVVEGLMDHHEGGEEDNVGIGTVCFGDAQVDTVASAIVGPQQSTAAFVISQDATPDHAFTRHDDNSPHGNVHVDTSIQSVCRVTDVDNSAGVPTTTVKSLDCQHGTGNEVLPQNGVEGLEGSNILTINSYESEPPLGRRNISSTERWNPPTMRMDDGPLSDPAGDPAPDCSQEVCMRAADGATAGGGLLSPPEFRPVTGLESEGSPEGDDVDPRTGCQRDGSASLLSAAPQEGTSISPPSPSSQMADGGPPRTSVDEEIVRFMEITLNGMAQVQDGLRGVFAMQKRRRVVQKRKMAVGNKYSK